ncbi:hypothetical protein H257_18197 [Aphanomyces astaci]|uniref:Uncharacterized protein n=1 Tax=Aphanomyces astaci TaxID=112090 RepID=W4FDL9_APHAT|nr:hypothetical protein H257_18197 [Aphanomyces astaci]ETV64989.1 hypothetical protein H257_18197 [Aphanomyces astaci]|eukprot:XP_009845514.1 hypothetical protein H257_18197 [Aphanomyces astaci]
MVLFGQNKNTPATNKVFADVSLQTEHTTTTMATHCTAWDVVHRKELETLSQFLHNSGLAHWRAAKRVLRYLRGTSLHGFMLGGRDYVSKPFLSAYVDANYAMCPDTRRCVGGFLILFFARQNRYELPPEFPKSSQVTRHGRRVNSICNNTIVAPYPAEFAAFFKHFEAKLLGMSNGVVSSTAP